MIGIYKFTNKLTGEAYIGQSVDIKRRYNQHKNRYDKFYKEAPIEDTYFHSMLRHYGFHNFDFEILEECDVEKLNERETYYIAFYNSLYPNGYNRTIGGDSLTHCKLSNDILKNIIDDLADDKLTEIEIAEKYSLHLNTISRINIGTSWYDKNQSYPIRKKNTNIYFCSECGKQLFSNCKTHLCMDCYNKSRTKNIPTKDELFALLSNNSFLAVGKMFNVSDNAVRKWCDNYNIPRYSKYYRSAMC